jgi:hypothetical protein
MERTKPPVSHRKGADAFDINRDSHRSSRNRVRKSGYRISSVRGARSDQVPDARTGSARWRGVNCCEDGEAVAALAPLPRLCPDFGQAHSRGTSTGTFARHFGLLDIGQAHLQGLWELCWDPCGRHLCGWTRPKSGRARGGRAKLSYLCLSAFHAMEAPCNPGHASVDRHRFALRCGQAHTRGVLAGWWHRQTVFAPPHHHQRCACPGWSPRAARKCMLQQDPPHRTTRHWTGTHPHAGVDSHRSVRVRSQVWTGTHAGHARRVVAPIRSSRPQDVPKMCLSRLVPQIGPRSGSRGAATPGDARRQCACPRWSQVGLSKLVPRAAN